SPAVSEEVNVEENPEELGEYLEGDILVPQSEVSMRTIRPRQSTTWPYGVVPYHIDGDFSEEHVDTILEAMDYIQNRSCIIFVPHTDEEDYVTITNMYSGCWSAIGRIGGRQVLNLGSPSCLKRIGTSIHELMHVLGFPHEQNRNIRDEYVLIISENIRSKFRRNFNRDKRSENFGVSYDYGSVMHYSQRAFSINGNPTIVPLVSSLQYVKLALVNTLHSQQNTEPGVRIGQRKELSSADILRLNRMYCQSES
ncbi:hypothetical protein KR093_011562, partial [Drosophila rubida]